VNVFVRNSQCIARLSSELHVEQLVLPCGAQVPRRRSVLVRLNLGHLSRGMTGAAVRIGALYFAVIALVAVLLLVWAKFGQ
jgi:hypothetical protein